MPEWVSAHQIPGVRQLGRRDEADTPGLFMLMGDNGWPSSRYQMNSIAFLHGSPSEAFDHVELKEASALPVELVRPLSVVPRSEVTSLLDPAIVPTEALVRMSGAGGQADVNSCKPHFG